MINDTKDSEDSQKSSESFFDIRNVFTFLDQNAPRDAHDVRRKRNYLLCSEKIFAVVRKRAANDP